MLHKFKCSDSLIKIRLVTYLAMIVHLTYISTTLLNLDLENCKELEMRRYKRYKWMLITTWFNLLTLAYLPLCILCDWWELKGQGDKGKTLNKVRSFIFSNIILPTTVFSDILFWRLWNLNKTLIMPSSAESYISIWSQHGLHTVSLAFVIIDLISVPRKRPNNLAPGLLAMLAFVSLYSAMCVQCIVNEEYLYPIFGIFSTHKLVVLAIYVYTSHLFYHTAQWVIVDIIWGQRGTH